MLNAILQKHALSYSKWLLWPCTKNKSVVQHVVFANQLATLNTRADVFLTVTPLQIPWFYYKDLFITE